MTDVPSAYIHRIHGHLVSPPRRWEVPALLRFMIGIWPASLTAVVVGTLAVAQTL